MFFKLIKFIKPQVSPLDALLAAIEIDCPPVHIRAWGHNQPQKWGQSDDQVISVIWTSLDSKKKIQA